jgi:tetratricopeptide (TPR) repeat protein
VRVGSFAGAYLAARIAETDNDLDSAIAYYDRALTFDPDNRGLQQSLMLALISTGQFERALTHAESLRDVPEVARFSRLALAVDALHDETIRGRARPARTALQSDLDRLITGVATAWALAGQGDGEAALEHLDGPVRTGMVRRLHLLPWRLIAEWAGMEEEALAAYEATAENVAAGSPRPRPSCGRWRHRPGSSIAPATRTPPSRRWTSPTSSWPAACSSTCCARRSRTARRSTPLIGAGDRRRVGDPAQPGQRAQPRRRRVLRAPLPAICAGAAPDSDSVLMQLASAAEQQRNPELAIAYYERVPADSPLHRLARMQKGLNLADLDRHDEAEEMLKVILEEDPDDVRAYLALGGVYHSQENYRPGPNSTSAPWRASTNRSPSTGTSSTSAASPMSG